MTLKPPMEKNHKIFTAAFIILGILGIVVTGYQQYLVSGNEVRLQDILKSILKDTTNINSIVTANFNNTPQKKEEKVKSVAPQPTKKQAESVTFINKIMLFDRYAGGEWPKTFGVRPGQGMVLSTGNPLRAMFSKDNYYNLTPGIANYNELHSLIKPCIKIILPLGVRAQKTKTDFWVSGDKQDGRLVFKGCLNSIAPGAAFNVLEILTLQFSKPGNYTVDYQIKGFTEEKAPVNIRSTFNIEMIE